MVQWLILLHEDFDAEFDALPEEVQGDTLNDFRHADMKELRFDAADGVWRVAFAFDPRRQEILLVAGDKSGVSKEKFCRKLIAKADERFDSHLARLKKERKHKP